MSEPSASALTVADIDDLAAAVASPDRRNRLLREIDRIAAERIDVVVFSASTCQPDSMVVQRIYSSNTQTYPTGAPTNKRETSWGRQVLQQKRVFVGEGHLAMAAAFDDQVNMEKAGVRSIINVPIVIDDKCIAVLNFGFGTEHLAARDLATARVFGLAAVPAFLD